MTTSGTRPSVIGTKLKVVCDNNPIFVYVTVVGKQVSDNGFEVNEDYTIMKISSKDSDYLKSKSYFHAAKFPQDENSIKQILKQYKPAVISRAKYEETRKTTKDYTLYRRDVCPEINLNNKEDEWKVRLTGENFHLHCDRLGSRSGGVLVLVDQNGNTVKDKLGHPFAFGFYTEGDGTMSGMLKTDEEEFNLSLVSQ